MWLSMSPNVKCCKIISSSDVEKVLAMVFYRITKMCLQLLPLNKLWSIGNIIDAAGPNWKALLADSTKAPKDYLPNALMDESQEINFSLIHISVDPVMDFPITNLPDPLHITKCVCTALEKSSCKKSKRCIMYKKFRVNLNMIYLCWIATGGNTVQFHETRLTMKHFLKDTNSRMDCNLAMQVLSGSS